MSEHINGTYRDQTVLFPNTIDQYVDKKNPVRFIDAFVDSLNLEKLGFKHSIPAETGRPSYNPSDLLKLYVYGYLNQVRSSRKLEKECHRNVEVDQNDTADSAEDESVNIDELKEKICKLEEEKQRYEQIQSQMKVTGEKEVSLVDPDSRLMRVDSQRLEVCYNIQASVDAKQHLIVDYDVINNSTDHHQLTTDAKAAKQVLGVDQLEALSDKGFYVANDLVECEEAGITVFMPIPAFNPTKRVGG